MYNGHDGNKNNLRTIEAQIVQKLKNYEARLKFTGSYKKKRVVIRKTYVSAFHYDAYVYGMPEHLDARTTISRDVFYCILASKLPLQNKKIKIKTSLPIITFLKKGH